MKAPEPKEQQILKSILNYLAMMESRGQLFYFRSPSGGIKTAEGRFFKSGRAGIPDITVLFEGRFIGFEVKRPSGRQSDAQKYIEQLMKDNGGEYYIVTSVEDIETILCKK